MIHLINITVEGLTVVNCSGARRIQYNFGVFTFLSVKSLLYLKNSIQNMTGYGLYVHNCKNVIITNCSYYHSALCNLTDSSQYQYGGGGVGIVYDTQYSNTGYTLELSHSNMTNCCGKLGGGLTMHFLNRGQLKSSFKNLLIFHGKGGLQFQGGGGGISLDLSGSSNVTLIVSNCIFFNGYGHVGGIYIGVNIQSFNLIIDNTEFLYNSGVASDIVIVTSGDYLSKTNRFQISMLNSTVFTKSHSHFGVWINTCCTTLQITNTSMTFVNKRFFGFLLLADYISDNTIQMDGCHFIGSTGVPSVIYLYRVQAKIINCIFSNNTSDGDGRSVITIELTGFSDAVIHSCIISDNNMTGITLIEAAAAFSGRNVIKNNRNTEGAGITLLNPAYITIEGELLLYNNTADKHGGALIVTQSRLLALAQRTDLFGYETIFTSSPCTLEFKNNSSSVIFSGNRAGEGGSDTYGAINDGL